MKKIILSIFAAILVQIGLEAAVSGTSDFVAVSGKVVRAGTEEGIKGVPVCDGTQIVLTDSTGRFNLRADKSKCHLVYVLIPADYEFSFDKYGCWADYAPLEKNTDKQNIEFALKPRTGNRDKCRLLVLGDPQQMSSRPHSAPSWNYVCEAMAKYRDAWNGGPLYAVSVGDMVVNEIEVPGKAEAYLETQSKGKVGFFCVPGNHDHVQKAPTYFESLEDYCKWFGPYNYSFNVGGVHCIFLDSCAWRETPDVKLTEGFNKEALAFLEADLALVDKSVPVLLFTHCPVTKTYGGGMRTESLGYQEMIRLFEGRNVEMWYGHIHFGSNWTYTEDELKQNAAGVKSLGSHLVMRCGGSWACSGEVGRDGTPRGFVELDIDGKSVHWQYHSIDANWPHDMYLMYPGQFADDGFPEIDNNALYCNIYMWDNSWGMPEVWVNGVRTGTMGKVRCDRFDAYFDPMYMHYYKRWENEGLIGTRKEPARNYDNSHLFQFEVNPGTMDGACVEVRVTDKWGTVHKASVKR